MDNTFTKRIFLTLLFIFVAVASFAQTITVGTVDPGPYGRGSSIAVPITISDASGCINIGNTYTLYLSDASGNFSPGTAIGTANSFYTPFVNGIIPAGTPAGTGYKVKVVSSSPVKTSTISAAFEIKATTGVTASASSDQNVATDVFGSCVGADGVQFNISSTSAAGNTTTASFNNELTQTPAGSVTLPSSGPGYAFTANAANYTVSIKSVDASGTIGTRDYELVNNYSRSNIGSTGSGFTCLIDDKGTLSFSIDVASAGGGVQVNYPGNLYTLNWGDGTSTVYTFCQLKSANGIVSHIFTLPSCGQGSGSTSNAFKVTNQISSPYCGDATFAPPSTTARVLIKPKVSFTGPTTACVGTQVILTNTSQPGPAPLNFTSPTCDNNPGALYDWYLDGVKTGANYTLNQTFTLPTSLAHGTHTILLHAQPQAGSAGCTADDVTQTICFENPPQPAFTIPAAVCQSATVPVIPTDASVIDATCAVSPTNSTHTYTWTVTGPAAVGYAGGTNANSTVPKFIFNTPGTYTVQLGISTSGCGQVLSTPQEIYVDDAATVSLSANITLCNTNQTLTFDNTAGSQTKTTFAGTTKPGASTFSWTVTGGPYSFAGGTSASSQYPQILFTGLGTYTVTANHTNSCNTATATQTIKFIVPPTVNAGVDQTICSTGSAALAGSVTGSYTSYAWVGGGGTFSAGRTALTTSYTPTTAEVTAGTVTLTLHGYNAGVVSPCDDVGDPIVITITPLVKVNSATTKTICSGTAVGYTITADHTPATFTWTASATTGSPTGFTASGTTNTISDVLVNLGTTNAVVTYLITPTYNGCPGPVFTFKVTVNATPTITATSPTICNVQPTNIALSTNVTGTKYRWTSVAQAGITGNTQQTSSVSVTTIGDVLTNSSVTTAKTVTYTITPYNGSCPGTPITAVVTVQPSVPSIPGPDREICGSTYTLEGNNPAPATGKWTIASGAPGVVFTDDTNPTTTVTGLVAGQVYQFTWTVSNLPTCVDAKTVTITVDNPPVAGTANATPSTVCKGSSSFIKLSGYYGSITKWQSSIDGGASWMDISNIADSYTTPALTQTTTFRAVMHSGVCADVYPTVTVTVVPPPVTSVPGADVVLCGTPPTGFSTLSYTLGANSPGTGTGKWTMVSGPGPVLFDDDTNPAAVVSNLVPGGTYKLAWTISGVSGTPCPPSSNPITITIEKPPVGGSTNTSTPLVCYGANGTINLAGYFGSVAKWQSSTNGTTWTDINSIADTYTYSNLTVTTTFRAWVHNGTQCPDVASDPVTVTVAPAIVPSNPGPDAVICGTVTSANPIISYTLQGNNPSPGTGKWTIKSGPTSAQFVDNTSPTTVVTNLTAGSVYEFQWTISGVAGSPCAPDGKAVTITVEKPPVGGITSTNPSTVCTGANGNITLSGQFGTITKWQSSTNGGTSWTDISFVGDTYPYTNLTTTTTFRAVVHNGTQCADAYSSETIVTVNPATVIANAGPNDEVCSITSYTLQGNNPSPGSGKWTVTSGQTGITFDNDTDPHAKASGLQPGNVYTFQWTINGLPGCTMNNSSVTITVDEGPVGGLALGTTDICGATTNGGVITLSGQSGSVVRWEKSTDNGTTWTAISSIADSYTYTNLTQSTQFRAIIHKAGLCGDVPSAPAIITIGTPPVTSAPGADKVLCNVTSYTLQGNSPGAGTGKWTIDAGPSAGVTFSDDTNPNATVSGLTAGNTYTFRWTITGTPPCNPSSNVVKITIDKLPVGGSTVGAATVCTGDNHGSITLGGQVGTVDHWESSIDGGTTWQTIASTNTVIPYDLLTQTTTFRAVVQSGSCGTATSTPTTITVGQPAVASVPGPNASICNATTYTLQANNPAPGTGKWTIDAGPTAGVTFSDDTKPNATVSGLAAGNIYTFRWTITGSAGCSTTTNTVTITVDELSLGGTTAGSKVFCTGPNAGQITLSGQRGVIDHWESSEDNGANWTTIANTSTLQSYSGLTTTTQYRAMVRNGTCAPVPSSVSTITINPPTVVASAGANQELCSVSTYTLQGNDPGSGTGKWTVDAGPPAVTFADDTKFNTAVNGLIAGNTYTFHWTITGLAPCDPTTSAVTIIIDKPSYGGTTAGAKAFCDGPNAGQITLSGQVGVIDNWESSVDNGAHWITIPNSSATLPYSGLTETTQYRAVVHNGVCAPAWSTVSTITINPLTTVAVAGPNKELCSVTSYTMQGNDPGLNNTGLWTVDGAPAGVTFADATKYNTVVNGLVAGNTYTFHWTITGVAPCGPSSSPVTIIVDKASYGGTTAGSTAFCAGPNVGQINLSNQVGTVDNWQKSVDNGVTWTDIPNTGNAYQYSNLIQTTQFRAIVHNGVCGPDPSSVSTITINPPPTVAVAGPNQELCATSTYTMQGNNPGANNTGLWTVDGTPAGVTFADATKYNTVVNGLQAGNTYTFRWTITGQAPCDPSASTVTLIIDKPSYGGTTAGSQVFCTGPNGGNITLSGQVGSVDYWQKSEDNGATWTNISNTTTVQTYSGLTQTTQYRAMVHNGVCGQDPSTVSTITINPPTVTAIAGPNQELCSITTYTMQGNDPGTTGSTGLWTVDAGPPAVTFVDPTKYNTVVNGLVAGNTYTFHWTITGAAPCLPSSSPVTIIIDQPSVGGVTAGSATYCAGPNYGQITLTGQTGTIDNWQKSVDNGATWTDVSNTTATMPYSALTQTTQYRAMVHNGVCGQVPSSVSTITINPLTTVAVAGPNKELCSVTTYTMQGNNPGANNTGLWTVDGSPAGLTFTDATKYNTTVNGLIAGNTYTFHWTITGLAPCDPTTSAVTIIIDKPSAGGTTDGSAVVCTGPNSGQITLSNQTGTVDYWQKSVDGGTTWINIANTDLVLPYSNLTQTTQFRAMVHNGVCGQDPSSVSTITVNPPTATAVAGPNQELCSVTTYTMQGNNPGANNTGLWTVDGSPAGVTFTDATQYNTQVNGLVAGNTYTFHWTISGLAPCDPTTSTVTLIIDKPSAGGTTDGSKVFCTGPNGGVITLSNQVGTIDYWQKSIDNGTTWTNITNTTGTQTYSNLSQTTQFRAMVHNGVCGQDPSTVSTITINPPTVIAAAGPNQELCSVTTYTMQGNDPGEGTGLWTVDGAPAGVTFADATRYNTQVNGLVPGTTYIFRWTISGLAPCLPTSSPVTIIIDKPSSGGVTAGSLAYCAGPNSGQITLSGQIGTVDYWQKSVDNGANWIDIANTASVLPYSNLTQTTQFRAMVHNGVCGQDPSTASTITINPPTVAAVAGPNQELCSVTTYTMQGNAPGANNTGLWTVDGAPAGVTFVDATKYNTVVNGLVAGTTYTFRWTITGLAPCPPTSDAVTIIIDKPSYGGTTDGATVFCAGPNGGQVTLSNQIGTVDYWQKSTDNGTTWINVSGNTSPILVYSNLTQTTQFRAMVHNGVCGQDPSQPTTITINPVTITAIAGANQELCGATAYTLQGNSPGTGTGLWTVDGSPAGVTFSNATLPNAVVSGLVAGNTYTFRWTITGQAPCDPSSSPVTIIIDEPSVGGTTDGSVVFCAGPNGGQINLTGQRGVVDHWEMSTDNGANWANIANAGLSQPYANLTQTTQFRAMVRNGVCPPVPSSVSTITINPATVTAIAGADQRLCNVTTYTLQGNTPGAGTGLWTVDAGTPPVTFSDAANPHAIVTGMVPGNTYNFHWTITGVAPCPSNSSAVKVIIDQLAIGGTTDGADVVCTGNNRGSITLTGQLGTIVRWEYSTDNGGHWQADNNTNNIYLYSNLTQTTQYRAVVSNGVCGEVKSTPTTITVGQPAIASVPGPDEAVCNVTSYTLHANNPAPGTGKWTVLLGPPGATFSNDTDPNATVTGLVPGNIYQFEWAITGSAGCAPNKRYVTITDDQPPLGGTTAGATTVCGGSNNGSVTLTGQFGTIVRWESTTNNGASWVKIDNETNILAYSNLTLTTKYRVLIHKDGKCGDVYSDPTTITVNPPTVAANAGPDDEVCSVTSYKLQGNAAGTGTGKWTVASGPAGVTFSNDTDPVATASGLIPGSTYQFRWTITGLPTCAINTDLVAITIDQAPIGGTTTGAATVCADGNKGDITLNGQFGTIIRWEYSTDNGVTWQPINNNVTNTYSYSGLAQTTQFRAILHIDGKCSDAPSTATTITVNPQTVVADAGKNFTICNTSIAKLNGNSPGPSTGLWTQTAGPTVTIANPASYQTIVSGLAKGNVYTFMWTIKGLAPCADTRASVTIGAYEDVVPSFTKTEDHICGTSTVTFTNTSTPSPTGTFEWNFGDGTPVVTAVNPPSHTFVPSPDGREMTYTITLTPTSNCEVKAPFVDYVKISPLKPVAALSPAQLSYCGTFSLSARNMSPGENSQYDFYLKDATGAIVQHVRKADTTTAVFQSITPAAPTVYSVYVVATDKCGNQGNSTPINISAAPSSLVSGVQVKGDVQSVCLGSPVTFQNISTGGDRFTISIYDASKKLIASIPSGSGDLNYTPKALGKYYVSIVAGSTGCGDAPASALREFNVSPTPVPRFTYTADANYNVTFYNNTPDAGAAPASTIKYKWDFGDGSARDTNYIPATHHYDITRAPYTVTLTATTPGTNCFDVYTNSVELKFHGDLFMPNAFIPTSANRELNTFRVKGFGMKSWHMQIFNNFGQLIWETTKLDANGSPTEGWDGTYKGQVVEQGVYIWQISATLLNGEDWRGMSINGATPSKTGPIHLIR